jgi:hypothetical protein
MPDITCPCGVQFHARPSDIVKGKRYCSRACYHTFGIGPSHPDWRGDAVSYAGMHMWITRLKGRPERCEFCGKTEGRLEWANVSHEYRREADDWMGLCVPCHRHYDCYARPTCAKGHPWTEKSTRLRPHGWRSCRICINERRRERRAAGKAG